MDTTNPAGHVLRVPTTADAGAVAELLRARDAVDLGRPEVTVGDVARQQHPQHGLVVGLPRCSEGVIAGERRATG